MGLFDLTTENSTLASRPWKDGRTFWTSFEFYPEWRGSRFEIFRGVAHHERQWWTKTEVVVRAFKTSGATHADWDHYRRCSIEARKIASHFNNYLASLGIPVKIWFNVPALVVMDNISEIMYVTRLLMRFDKRFGEDEVVAFEELIDGDFKTFVDDTRNVTENRSDILGALCHFSYHVSNGQYILNNLKGVKNGPDHEEKPNSFCLTTPRFDSTNKVYGPSDRGQSGIQEFFKTHHCSAICQNFIPGLTESGSLKALPGPLYAPKLDQNQTQQTPEVGPVNPPSYEESQSQQHKTCT